MLYFIFNFISDPPANLSVILSSPYVRLGEQVTLTCHIEEMGYPTVTLYMWLKISKYGGSQSLGTNFATLHIAKVTIADEGEYVCKGKNEISEVQSTKTKLTIIGKLIFVSKYCS